jgi:hypothetical protein
MGYGLYNNTYAMLDGKLVWITPVVPPLNPVWDGLVGYWPLDGSMNSTVGNHLPKYQSGIVYDSSIYKHNQSTKWNATSTTNYVSYNPSTGLNFKTNPFSVCAWIYMNNSNYSGYVSMVYDRNAATEHGWRLSSARTYAGPNSYATFWTSSGAVWSSSDITKVQKTAQILINPSTWYFAVGVRDVSTISLYLDASLKSIMTFSMPVDVSTETESTGLTIGSLAADEYQYFHPGGYVDEVMVFNRALTETDISTLYAAGAGIYY